MTTIETTRLLPRINGFKDASFPKLRIGLFGCGIVGSGIVHILSERRKDFKNAFGIDVSIENICVRDIEKERAIDVPRHLLTTDANSLLYNDEIDCIIEVIGGYHEAKAIIERSLMIGKDVITANKLVLARDIKKLLALSRSNGSRLRYAASVCGSVPVLRAIDELRTHDTIRSIRGIVNGSTNFILTLMTKEGVRFEDALREAQLLGFAEADPSLDVSGADAAQKLSVLIYHAFGEHLKPEHIDVSGIEDISEREIHDAKVGDSVVKLIASAERGEQGEIIASVKPTEVAKSHLFAHTSDEFNALEIQAVNAGPQLLYGKGAGSLPTASAVISDLTAILQTR
jgi:homoserine dehydrogenase